MKIKLFSILCLILSAQAAFAATVISTDESQEATASVVETAPAAPASPHELTPECKAYSLEHTVQTLNKIEVIRNSITQELRTTGYANSAQGYLIFAFVVAKNPYMGLKNLESGTINTEKGLPLSKKQKVIMQNYCDDKGQITMELITQ